MEIPAPQIPIPAPLPVDPRISSLLASAANALAEKRLTTPIDNNAYVRYLQVLSIDPENREAESGIAFIVETYLRWAVDNIQRGSYRKAINYVNKAKSVDERHTAIVTLEKILHLYDDSGKPSFSFSRSAISDKSPATLAEIRKIALEVVRHDATVVIEAPTDAIGRWIYQQLNDATEDRVHARFLLTNNIRIVLIY